MSKDKKTLSWKQRTPSSKTSHFCNFFKQVQISCATTATNVVFWILNCMCIDWASKVCGKLEMSNKMSVDLT